MINKKILKIGMYICIVAVWIIILIGFYQAYGIYKYFQEHPQIEFSWKAYEAPPAELLYKARMINAAKRTIWIGLLFGVIFQVLDYFRDKENHFITFLYRKIVPVIEKIGSKLEDDEEDKHENKN